MCFIVYFLLVVVSLIINCLERLVSAVTYYMLTGMLNSTHKDSYGCVDLTYNDAGLVCTGHI